MGPHPYPWMVRELQRVVGDEAREQCRALLGGADPDVVVACVGRRVQRRRHLRRVRRRHGAAWSGWRRPAARPSPRASPGCSTGCGRASPGRGGPDPRGRVDLGRPRLPGHRARARPPGRHRPGPLRDGRRRRGAGGLPAAGRDRGHHPGPRVGPRPGLGGPGGRRRRAARRARPCWSTLSGRGDKDVAQVRDILRGRPVTGRTPAHRRGAGDASEIERLRAPARRRAQAARPLRHRRDGRRLARCRRGAWPAPGPTPSRSASPSPTR